MPDDTQQPTTDENHPTHKDTENSSDSPAPRDETVVIMHLKGINSPTVESIPARSAATCSHIQSVCSLCVRWWALDWTIDFTATAAGRELLALRRALDRQ